MDMRSDPIPYSESHIPWREWRHVGVIWLAALILWIPYYFHARPIALQDPDAQDYAQIARNVAEGKGFTTSIMPLGGLEWMRQTGRLGQSWWNLHRFPLPSLIQAGFIKVVGPRDFAISLSSALFYFLGIPLVYLFARRMFSHRVGVLATFLFAFNGGQMGDSITGLTEPAALFLFLAALYLVLWPSKWWHIPLAGLITGLAFLNRYSVVLYALPMLVLIWKTHNKRPLAAVLEFIAPAAVVALPWLYRNYLIAGDPLFSLTTALMVRYMTAASPHTHDWYQFVYEKPTHFWMAHPWWTIKKWLTQTADLWWNNIGNIGALGYVFPFFVVSTLRPLANEAQRLRRWLLGVFVLHFVTLGLLSNIPRYYAIFTPFLIIYAADVLLWIWDQVRPGLSRQRAGFALFVTFPLLFSFLYIIGPPRRPREDRTWVEWQLTNQRWIHDSTPQDAIILSDVPWSVAWYGYRRSLPLPPKPEDLSRFNDYGITPDGIYLKSPRKRMNVPDEWDQWRAVQFGRLPLPGYGTPHEFPDHSVYYARLR